MKIKGRSITQEIANTNKKIKNLNDLKEKEKNKLKKFEQLTTNAENTKAAMEKAKREIQGLHRKSGLGTKQVAWLISRNSTAQKEELEQLYRDLWSINTDSSG